MTNYERWFSTPGRMRDIRIEDESDNESMMDLILVWNGGNLLAELKVQEGQTLYDWLNEEES